MKKQSVRRGLPILLCLCLLAAPICGPLGSLLTVVTEASPAIELSDSQKLKLTIKWINADGSDFKDTVLHPYQYDGNNKVRAKISASGPSGLTAEVEWCVLGLGAEEAVGKPSGSFTLTNGQSKIVEVTVYKQKRWDNSTGKWYTDSSGNKVDAPSVVLDGSYHVRRQFGVTIKSHSENSYIEGERTVRAFAGGNSNGDYLLRTYRNTASAVKNYYSSSTQSAVKALRENGYTYIGAVKRVDRTSKDDYTFSKKDRYQYVDASGDKPGGHGQRVEDQEKSVFTFKKSPSDIVGGTEDMKQIQTFFSGYNIYIAGTFRVHKEGSLNNGPLVYKVGYADDIDTNDRNDWYSNKDIGDRKLVQWFRSGQSNVSWIDRGGEYDYWWRIDGNKQGEKIEMGVFNNDKDLSAHKIVFNVEMGTIIVDETKPQIVQMWTESAKSTISSTSDELYLMLRMSEPVQVYGTDKFEVRGYINGSASKVITFKYVDGNHSDVLIFRADLSKWENEVFDNIVIQDVKGCTAIADFFLDKFGENNQANLTDMYNGTKVKGYTVKCSADLRRASIGNDTNVDTATTPAQTHTVKFTVKNLGEGGSVTYQWSKDRDINKLSATWQKAEPDWTADESSPPVSITGKGMNGDYYLHVIATTKAGARTRATFNLGATKEEDMRYRFDNAAPVIQSVSYTGDGQNHGKYLQTHKFILNITDPQTDDKSALSKITEVWYRVTDSAGAEVKAATQLYGSGAPDGKMSFEAATHRFTTELSAAEIGIAAGTYGSYTVSFMAKDAAGNMTKVTDAHKVIAQFDTRSNYSLSYTAAYAGTPASPVVGEYGISGLDIYYTTPQNGDTVTLALTVLGDASGTTVTNQYALHTVVLDGQTVYKAGKWQYTSLLADDINYSSVTWDSTVDPHKAYGLAASPTVRNNGMQMEATVNFLPDAAGRYDFTFIRDGELISEILSVYVTPQNAEPINYTGFYDEERLLINKVWQFSTAHFYSQTRAKAISYDGSSGTTVAAKPIFSSKEKALEYALYMECQDIEFLHLTDQSSQIILALNDRGVNDVYIRDEREAPIAEVGQTWIRYKSSEWKPEHGMNSDYWVYYFLCAGHVSNLNISATDLESLKAINVNWASAIYNNAMEIANYNGTYSYLTKNSANAATDSYGQPYYYKGAVFYRDIVVGDGDAVYQKGFTYRGDSGIYSSFIDYDLNGNPTRLPLVGNYKFTTDTSHMTYYRAPGATDWIPVQNGQELRTFGVSGVYELKEIGGGYRHYYIYCDFDAPLLHYTHVRSGESVGDGQFRYFSQDYLGNFQAQSAILKYIIDSVHPYSGVPTERDNFSYLYLTRSTMGGMVEELAAFYTVGELNALLPPAGQEVGAEDGFRVPNGVYVLHVYDRLGNGYSIPFRVNDSPIVIEEPLVKDNISVTFYINRDAAEIETFSVTRVGANNSLEVDEQYAKVKEYVKSGTYTLYVRDVFGQEKTVTAVLKRELPTVTFYYKSGSNYVKMDPITDGSTPPAGAASVTVQGNTYIVSSATDIRIAYPSSAGYAFSVTPQTDASTGEALNYYRENSSGTHKFLDMSITSIRWTMSIFYKHDEDTRLIITCINDFEPPTVTAEAEVPVYDFHYLQGIKNVLFAKKDATQTVNVKNGQRVNTKQLTLSWTDGPDGSGIDSIYYTVDGGERIVLSSSETGMTLELPGQYAVYITDLLGNTALFEITITAKLSLEATLEDGTPIAWASDPTQYMQGSGADAIYNQTTYTGGSFELFLQEEMTLTFLYQNSTPMETLARISYKNGQLSFERYNGTNGFTATKTVELKGTTVQGEFTEFGFPLEYFWDKRGMCLTFSKQDKELELWQICIADLAESSPSVLQIERSTRVPALVPVKADSRNSFQADAQSFTGINEGFTFTGDANELADVIFVRAYHSTRHVMDFSSVPEQSIYEMVTSGLIGMMEKEGYYKVVVTNKYGNTQTLLIRVNFGADMDVILEYRDPTVASREYVISGSGSLTLGSNESVVVRVWNPQASIEVRKGTESYQPLTRAENGCIEMTFLEVGVYSIYVKDDCGNEYELIVEVRAPQELPYDAYLTGFNEEAAMREQQYTNAPLGLSQEAMQQSNIAYVAVRELQNGTWTVLYDTLSQTKVIDPANFERSIGTQNGSYEVLFADAFGNCCTTQVHISNREQLFISRSTKNSAGNMAYTVRSAEVDGVWSNFIVTLKNSAPAYHLWVDGKEASFNQNNELVCELPYTLGDTASAEHSIVYVDNYGNKYSFTVHLMRRTPAIRSVAAGEELLQDGKLYVKGDFGYTWDDDTVSVQYTLDSNTKTSYPKGQMLTQDGVYVFTFTDIAGNMETRRIQRDTAVYFHLLYDSKRVESGIAVSGRISIEGEEAITVTKVMRNGEELATTQLAYGENGFYVVTLTDAVGNEQEVEFDIFNTPVQSFTYVSKGNYAIYQVWLYTEGVKQPYNGILLNEEGRQEFHFWDDGTYEMDLLHIPTNTYTTCTVVIDNIAPAVSLVGDITDGVTRADITLDGLSQGDTVEVWINGLLEQTHSITASKQSPEFSEAGTYKVVIRDAAGNETVHEFVREFTTNAAANALICLALLGMAVGGALFLFNRGRVRVK